MTEQERVERVAWAIADVIANRRCDGKPAINDQRRAEARAAIAALTVTPQEAATFDYCPNCGQPHGNGVDRFCHRCLNDEISPQEAAKVLPDWEGFGRAMLEDWPVRDVDGAELFDLSLKYGLIAEVPGGYDPEQHIDAEGISPETGDPWYEYTFREDSHE